LLHEPYGELYRRQVVKQADLMLAMHWRGDLFTREDKARAFDYYEPLTVRDSSLSASTQAVIAAEVGHLELAHAYVAEAALMDLQDLAHNTKDGLHIASLAGAWLGLVAGLGGLRDTEDRLSFAPGLPRGISALKFSIRWRGSVLRVEVDRDSTTYLVRQGCPSVRLTHATRDVEVEAGQPVTLENEHVVPRGPAPEPPRGREPARRARRL
jgi:alpha,alpha-trehalose phosphorylase